MKGSAPTYLTRTSVESPGDLATLFAYAACLTAPGQWASAELQLWTVLAAQSRRHLACYQLGRRTGVQFSVRGVGSLKGTYVNREHIDEEPPVRSGGDPGSGVVGRVRGPDRQGGHSGEGQVSAVARSTDGTPACQESLGAELTASPRGLLVLLVFGAGVGGVRASCGGGAHGSRGRRNASNVLRPTWHHGSASTCRRSTSPWPGYLYRPLPS